MARDISVSIAVQGEKEFNQALKDAQSAVKLLDSQLKLSESTFKTTGDKQAYMESKSELLNQKLEQQKKNMEALNRAIAEASKEFGASSSKTDRYRIALNKAEASVVEIEKELRDLGDEADNTAEDFEDMGKKIGDSLDSISLSSGISAFKDLGDMVGGAFETLGSIEENSREYRRQISFLEQNAIRSGQDVAAVQGLMEGVAALTGDVDGALEGVNTLLAAGFDSSGLAEAINLLGGAVTMFPETMKFENLSESLQETISTGSATGAFAELIGRLGGNVDDLNTKLATATTEEEKQKIVLAALNDGPLKGAAEHYAAMNTDLVGMQTAQNNFNTAMAGLGEALAPAMEAWVNFKTGVIEGITGMITKYQEWNDALLQRHEEAKTVVEEAVADTATLDSLEAYNEAIAQADAEGAYIRANALMAERDKFLIEQAKKTAAELDQQSQQDSATIGGNISTGVGNGITEESSNAINAADSLWQNINNQLGRTVTVPVQVEQVGGTGSAGSVSASSYAKGSQGSKVTVVTQIDGETVAEATAGGVGARLGASASRNAVYG